MSTGLDSTSFLGALPAVKSESTKDLVNTIICQERLLRLHRKSLATLHLSAHGPFCADMTRFGFQLLPTILLAISVGVPGSRAASTNDLPDFKELYELVHSHLPGMADADLNRAAVQGLLTNLRGKVSLVGEGTSDPLTGVALISRSTVLENDVAYVRVARVEEGLAKEISGKFEQLSATNKLKGVVLDLRFSAGDDYQSAAAVAD